MTIAGSFFTAADDDQRLLRKGLFLTDPRCKWWKLEGISGLDILIVAITVVGIVDVAVPNDRDTEVGNQADRAVAPLFCGRKTPTCWRAQTNCVHWFLSSKLITAVLQMRRMENMAPVSFRFSIKFAIR